MVKEKILTGVERDLRDDEIIVSKTDLNGNILYCNDIFMTFADYSEEELVGRPHNIIRHPQMPRCVFKLLWDTVQSGKELFAYVINRSRRGDHYWVFAHVTPDFDMSGNICGYHSFRRAVDRRALAVIEPLYGRLRAEEARHADRHAGIRAGMELLEKALVDKGSTYEEFVFGL